MVEKASKYDVAGLNALFVVLCDVIMICSFRNVHLIFLSKMNEDHGS